MNENECTPQEQMERLNVCKGCDRFVVNEDTTTKCSACECSISLLITFVDQSCPLGKW